MKVRLVFGAIGLVFLSIGLAGTYWLFILPLMLRHDVKNWAKTPCTIVSGQVSKHSSGRSTGYSIDITYEYEYNNDKYYSDRYDFISGYRRDYDRMKETVRSYPKTSIYS